jgi:hypothetical protein
LIIPFADDDGGVGGHAGGAGHAMSAVFYLLVAIIAFGACYGLG